MAAAARPPGLGDARVPCPHCGGLIHPVAGRCKHCKEDLSLLRTNRPQAAAVLPALNGRPTPMPVAGNGTSVHLAAPAAAVPIAVDPRDGSAPILPQRTTGHSMSAQRPSGSLLRNWPMLVIILAMLAIVTAVVIMVLPPGDNNGGSGGKQRQLMPAPAPDRMETMPDKSSQADPWAQPGAPRNQPNPTPAPRVTPDPPDPDVDDPDDLYGGLGGGTGLNGGVFIAMANQACKKLKTCSAVDQTALDLACDTVANMPVPPVPTSCASAQRCMAAIDNIDCDTTSANTNPMNLLLLMQDCTKAATEC